MFGVLIFIHELGHYIFARLFKVGILDFSIGMGPKIFGWRGKHNKFTLRALPFGGYVSMLGEYSEYEESELDEEDKGKTPLNSIKVWKRMAICLAGPVMNFILGFLVTMTLVITTPVASNTVSAFDADANSNSVLQIGDEILEIDGSRMRVHAQMVYKIAFDGTKPLDVLVLRDGQEVLLPGVMFPTVTENGVTFGMRDFYVLPAEKTFGTVMYQSFWQSVNWIESTVQGVVKVVSGQYGVESLSGPVGIGEQIGEVISSSGSTKNTIISLATMLALISVNLGLMNLLPLPVLDGGRIIIYLIEGIRRKPIDRKYENAINAVFMVLLVLLTVFITFKDVIGLFG